MPPPLQHKQTKNKTNTEPVRNYADGNQVLQSMQENATNMVVII